MQENFELVQLLVSALLEARKMTLQQYVTKMARGNTCGYEVTLLILSHMFQLPFLVIRSDMLWLSQNVRPTECPIVLVQIADGSFLGTRTKKPVSIGTVPRIKLTVKKSEAQNIMHSTPARKQRGVRNDFQPLGQEILSPIVDRDIVPTVNSDNSYSLDSKTNKLGDSSGELTDLDVKHSMSTEYPELSVASANRSINSEDESAALVDYPAFDGDDGMFQQDSNIVDDHKEAERQTCDDANSSGTEEIDVDNCDTDGYGEADEKEEADNLEDGQRILPSDEGVIESEQTDNGNTEEDGQKILPTKDTSIAEPSETIDSDMTIDPNGTIDGTAATKGNEIIKNDAEEDVHDQMHGEQKSVNVIQDTEKESTPKRTRLGLFGPKCKRQKLCVKLQDLSVDLAMPINQDDVFNLQKGKESEENYILQYCCNKCQQRTFTRDGYETHLLHAHQIRNADKYPPTLIKKTFQSPESLHLDSISSATTSLKQALRKKLIMKTRIWKELVKNRIHQIMTTLTTMMKV